MVANILPAGPPQPLGWGQNFNFFSEYGHVAYQIKGNDACSNRVANSFTHRLPPPDTGVGSKGQISSFSEYGHVAYRIKWNHECNNKDVNVLPAAPPPLQLFQDIFVLHIKLNGITNESHGIK